MLHEALIAASDLGRLQEIAGIVIRHGFGELVGRIGLVTLLKRAGRALHWEAAAELRTVPPAERARSMLEQLGPTFVKL
ncbi:MAG: ubiquinone biosynthesis protein UbiB, partial [Planctomycetes bacterium]|nr:ubiquinone biosynthesis protein UbiB [Planctomycetota bacterium]